MHTSGTNGDEKASTIVDNGSAQKPGRDNLSRGCSRRAVHAPDHFLDRLPLATLTERVVDFLERYNKSIYDFGPNFR